MKPETQFPIQGSALNTNVRTEPIVHRAYSLKGEEHDSFTRAVRLTYSSEFGNMSTEAVMSLEAAQRLIEQLQCVVFAHECDMRNAQPEPMKVGCAWCGKQISGPKAESVSEYESHGICPPCAAIITNKSNA
jgi:hypothetical protein